MSTNIIFRQRINSISISAFINSDYKTWKVTDLLLHVIVSDHWHFLILIVRTVCKACARVCVYAFVVGVQFMVLRRHCVRYLQFHAFHTPLLYSFTVYRGMAFLLSILRWFASLYSHVYNVYNSFEKIRVAIQRQYNRWHSHLLQYFARFLTS